MTLDAPLSLSPRSRSNQHRISSLSPSRVAAHTRALAARARGRVGSHRSLQGLLRSQETLEQTRSQPPRSAPLELRGALCRAVPCDDSDPTAARRDTRPINRAQRLAPIGRPARPAWPSGRTRACNLCSPCQCQYRRPCLQRPIAPQVRLSTGSGALQHERARVRAQHPE